MIEKGQSIYEIRVYVNVVIKNISIPEKIMT